MAQTKATKKFEKRHLKDTLERRKGAKKGKQQAQLKAKKKARRAEEEGREPGQEKKNDDVQDGGRKSTKDAFQDMSVDDFFQGGFDVPEMPKKAGKRKRVEEDGSGSGSDEDEDLDENFASALAENDPELYKDLQLNDPSLFDAEMVEGLSDDEDEAPKRKKAKKSKNKTADDDSSDSDSDGGVPANKNELTNSTLTKWTTALQDTHSLRAAKEVVLAFRSAAHVSDDSDEQKFKYTISDPEVYHNLLKLALTQIPDVLQHHLPVQENKSGKQHVATDGKKFRTLAPLLKSHTTSILHLLSHLTDASTLRLTLTSTLPLLPYLLSFKKLVRDLAKSSAATWSDSAATETVRISAFLILRRLALTADAGIREDVLKTTYQSLVKNSRNTTTHTLAGINLMKNSAAELWGLDTANSKEGGGVAYTTAFTSLRQLAIHLRAAIQHPSSADNANGTQGYKQIYNWQYIHALDFWSRVLSLHCANSPKHPLQPLIYPLVQVTLGALRLMPTATYFPLRFHLLRALLRLSKATGTFIPLAAPLYEVLASAEMRRAPKASTLKPLDFETSLRVAKSYLRTRVYQDGIGDQVIELLSEFLGGCWGKSIAFPELALPVTVVLKRWLKDVRSREPGKGNKNQKLNSAVSLLVQKVEANAAFVSEARAKVSFAPDDRKGVNAFLEDTPADKMPLGAFVAGQRRVREERARVVEAGRVEEERRKSKGDLKEKDKDKGRKVVAAAEEISDEDEDEESIDGEIDGSEDGFEQEGSEVSDEDLIIDGDDE